MDILTILFMCLAIGLFLARYVVPSQGGVDFLCACVSICSLALVIKDESIPQDNMIIFLIPIILIVMLTFINLAMGDAKKRF